MKKVLLIEDDRALASGILLALSDLKLQILQAFDGDQGLHMARTFSPNLIILDIMMPHLNGFEVISELRGEGFPSPILVLSARSSTNDKVRGLDLGANDYLAKPFELDEFKARVRRLLSLSNLRRIEFGANHFDFEKRLLRHCDQSHVSLTPKELKLLEFFLHRDERLVRRSSILDAVWGDDYDGTDRTVDNLVVSLRKKIGENHIQTVRGEGYRFVIKP